MKVTVRLQSVKRCKKWRLFCVAIVAQEKSASSYAALEVVVENGTTTYSCVAVNKAGSSKPSYCHVHGIPAGK